MYTSWLLFIYLFLSMEGTCLLPLTRGPQTGTLKPSNTSLLCSSSLEHTLALAPCSGTSNQLQNIPVLACAAATDQLAAASLCTSTAKRRKHLYGNSEKHCYWGKAKH